MRRILMSALSAVLVLWAFATLAVRTAAPPAPPPSPRGGAPSVEALLDELLAAVRAHDEIALQQLRVSEDEYRTIIVPGTVDVGQPPRVISAPVSAYFWRMLDTKSRDFTYALLQRFGGQRLQRRTVGYSKGSRKYGGYTALGQVHVVVVDETGQEQTLRSGTIAAVDGRYKFIGLNWND